MDELFECYMKEYLETAQRWNKICSTITKYITEYFRKILPKDVLVSVIFELGGAKIVICYDDVFDVDYCKICTDLGAKYKIKDSKRTIFTRYVWGIFN